MCLECSKEENKYKCTRCVQYCCSFECFNKHKNVDCTPATSAQAESISEDKPDEIIHDKCILQFKTDDTVPSEKLAELAHSETLLDLLRNQHLREFLKEIDSAPNAWKAMKVAMLEPLFIEFADECLKIVEDRES